MLAALVGLLGLLWPGLARAAENRYGVVTLDLQLASGEVPTHLCVVSEARSPRTRKTLWEILEREPDQVAVAGRPGGVSWRVKPEVWSGDPGSSERLRCSDDPQIDCRPRVELPEGLTAQSELFVACTADSLTGGDSGVEPRPLFVLLEFLEGSPPQIESVRLTGGVGGIGVLRANLDHVIVTARSLGGAYLPDQRSKRATVEDGWGEGGEDSLRTKVVQLDLTPRCQKIELKLPRTRLRPSDRSRLDVRVHGVPIDETKCVENLSGTDVIQVLLPPAPLGVGSVDVELAATPDGLAGARFGGDFEGEWPRTPFALQFNQVTFSWRRPDCIYPKDECPTATLETGTVCSATVTKSGCDYRCPGEIPAEGGIDLQLPMDVTFEKAEPTQRWTDKLAQNGQMLTSYVPADQTYLEASLIGWETEVPDNKINEIVLYGEDGAARRFGITRLDTMLLKVPGASCEAVRFQPKGDRAHEEIVATVDEGRIDFGNPHRSARIITFNLTLLAGGGPAWSTLAPGRSPPLYFSGLGMFGVQIRPRKRGWQRVAFEIRAGGTLGRWGQTLESTTDGEDQTPPTRDPPDGTDGDTDSDQSSQSTQSTIGWARILFEGGIVGSVRERWAIGAGLGLGVSLPFRTREELRNESLRFIWSPSIEGRFRIRTWLRLIVQVRGVFGERAFKLSNQEQTAMIDTQTAKARSLIFLFGLQFSF